MDERDRARQVWRTLEDRLRSAAPHLLKKIPVGASPVVLSEFEKTLGIQVPPLLRELYLLHNGIGMPALSPDCFVLPCDFLPLESLIENWTMMKELLDGGHFSAPVRKVRGPVRAVWWSAQWLPITSDSAGNHYCVDLDPAPGGVAGQVIAFWHDDGERTVANSDVGAFLIDHLDVREWAAREPAKPEPN